jgi:hypothetical protein
MLPRKGHGAHLQTPGHGAHLQASGDVARVIASPAGRVLRAGVSGR